MNKIIHRFFRRPSDGVAAGDAIPFYWDGVYHLFYLATPPGTDHYPDRVRCSWRHVTSTNLVDWEEKPTALIPSDNKNDPDNDGVWTGSVIFAEGQYHIFYTGYSMSAKFPQTICHATSKDCIHFEKDPNNPIITPDTKRYESIDWRDPFVFWNEDEELYWMLLSARLVNNLPNYRGCIVLAISKDLSKWEVHNPLYAPFTTFCPECPELFKMSEKWYLIYSRFSESAQTIYRISEGPRGPWRTPLRDGLDGRRWYAAKSLGDGKRRIAFGWVHEKEGGTDDGIWEWGGDFCVPRELYPQDDFEIAVRCPEEILKAYDAPFSYDFNPMMGKWTIDNKDVDCCAGDQLAYGFLSTPPSNYQFKCTMQLHDIQGNFGILIKADDELKSAHAIVFEPGAQRVSIVRWPEPLDAFWRDLTDRKLPLPDPDGPRLIERPVNISNERAISCNVLISGTIVEVFIDDTVSLSHRIYDSGGYEMGLFVQSGHIVFMGIEMKTLGEGI